MREKSLDDELNIDSNWEMYMSVLWSNLFEKYNLNTNGNVVEIAPGVRYKIGLALKHIGFKGNLYIIEPHKPTLDIVVKKYKELLPNSNIIGINCKFDKSIKHLPKHLDAIVGNHCLDDIVIGEYLNNSEFEFVFNAKNKMESQDFLVKKWDELYNKRSRLNAIKNKTINNLVTCIETFNPKIVFLSQYYSSFYYNNGEVCVADTVGREILTQIKQKFIIDESKLQKTFDSIDIGSDTRCAAPNDPLWNSPISLNNTHSSSNWLVGIPINKYRALMPSAYKRLGKETFVLQNAYSLMEQVKPIYINEKLYKEIFNIKFDWEEAQKVISNLFSITLNPEKGESRKSRISVYVDKQTDDTNISLNNNLGSGRAYYMGKHFNIKGEKTVLATSEREEYNNGKFPLTSAIFEAITANVISHDIEFSSFRVLAILDINSKYKFIWNEGELPCGQIVRLDNGKLDRITHLFQNNISLNKEKIYSMADKFGKLEAEKFVERILHGAWSCGNISPEAQMIDLDTVCSVKGRNPQYSFADKYITNYFGYEYLGQIKVIETIINSKLNKDNVTADEVKEILTKSYNNEINDRFINLMGFDSVKIDEQLRTEINQLAQDFKNISNKMYPNFIDMAVWKEYLGYTYIFDFSRFFKYYPILKRSKYMGIDNAINILLNMKSGIVKDRDIAPNEEIKEFLERNDIIVSEKEQFLRLLQQIEEFINSYDIVYNKILNNNIDKQCLYERKAFIYNEDREYLMVDQNVKLAIMKLYKNDKVQAKTISRLIELIINSSIRNHKYNSTKVISTNTKIFEEGYFTLCMNNLGKHYLKIVLFKDIVKENFNNTISLLINGKEMIKSIQENEDEFIINSKANDNLCVLNGYKTIFLKVNGKKIKFHLLTEKEKIYFDSYNMAQFIELLEIE